MNESTELNSELLSADARGRKHIPVAVFAVILIHVVLFLVLLIAAGCRSSARVKKDGTQETQVAQTESAANSSQAQIATAPAVQNPIEPIVSSPAIAQSIVEPVTATEPQVEAQPPVIAKEPIREVTQQKPAAKKVEPRPATKTTASKAAPKQQYYIVKSGDTLEKIAKLHGTSIQAVRTANKMKKDMIFPGQKLQLHPVNAAQVQSKPKRSNEV